MRRLLLPLNIVGALWDAGMLITGNVIDAMRFYYESMAEVDLDDGEPFERPYPGQQLSLF